MEKIIQHIEPLECRQLLSASVHGAAKTKPSIPNLVGTFTGTDTQTKPTSETTSLQVTFSSESSKGALAGTILVGGQDTNSVSGTVNKKGAIKLKIINDGKTTVTGKYNSSTQEISGTYKHTAKGQKPASGTFSLSAVVG